MPLVVLIVTLHIGEASGGRQPLGPDFAVPWGALANGLLAALQARSICGPPARDW